MATNTLATPTPPEPATAERINTYLSIAGAAITILVLYFGIAQNAVGRAEVTEMIQSGSPYVQDKALLTQSLEDIRRQLDQLQREVRDVQVQASAHQARGEAIEKKVDLLIDRLLSKAQP